MKQLIPLMGCLLMLSVGCQKSDDIRPVTPVPEVDTIVPDRPVPALFSINENRQVRFAPGNLQYIEGVWRFAEQQTDLLPYCDPRHCDLFNWSSTSTNWGLDSIIDQQDYNNPYIDWGTNPQIVATYGDGWRVLDIIEWDYLLNERLVDGQAGEGHSWTATHINGQYGIVIYPDGYTRQAAAPDTLPDSCVFLPATGWRLGYSIFSRGNYGYYWSATSTYCPTGAAYLTFHLADTTTLLKIENSSDKLGYAVRLVRDI